MTINQMALGCLLLPIIGAFITRMLGSNTVSRWLPIVCMTGSMLLAMALFRDAGFVQKSIDLYQYTWLDFQGYRVEIGFWLDALSLMMMVIVTTVSWLVHIYSLGYMARDPNQYQYFSYVSFFTFAMLLLVMGNNLLQVFMGWEGVGLASYLLIGFWQTKAYPSKASIKAFVVNRVGDMGLLIAMGLILMQLGSLEFGQILSKGSVLTTSSIGTLSLCEWICLGLLVAAMGKSAQMPLQVWLPDSMAGPTPISALIHAATMVTAGIYLIARFAPWFELAPIMSLNVVFIGFTTMILMGIVAIFEYDIKRIIAYSTLSQLGMMIGVCGLSGYTLSLYHLATHAAFKALLFLGAGAIIIAADHEQDIRKIGSMRHFPTIHLAMLVGLASMMAIPPLSGFFSKDAMLLLGGSQNMMGILLIGAVITAIYSTRLYYWLFWQPKQSVLMIHVPYSVRWPLWVLGFFSVYLGYWMVPFLPVLQASLGISSTKILPILATLQQTDQFLLHAFSSPVLSLILSCAIGTFIVLWRKPGKLDDLLNRFSQLVGVINSQYGLNPLFERVVVNTYQKLSRYCFDKIDQRVIDQQMVLGTASRILVASKPLVKLSDGRLYHYIMVMVFGVFILLVGLL